MKPERRHFTRSVTGRLLAFTLLACFAAGEVVAQRTGTRIGRNAEAGNVADAEFAMRLIAMCVAARRPDFVRRLFSTLPGTPEEAELMRREADDFSLCLDSNRVVMDAHQLRFQPRALRRPLAVAFVERRVSEAPAQAPVLPDARPWFLNRVEEAGSGATIDRGSLVVQDFGHCVVLRAWQDARSLFATQPDTPEEAAVIQRLQPHLGPCLFEGMTINLTRRTLRLALAEPFYHVMTATPQSAPAANAEE